MIKLSKLKNYLLEILIVAVSVSFIFYYMLLPNISEIGDMKKAENVQNNLKEIRIALEKYYQITGEYPNLAKEGAAQNLNILIGVDKLGKSITFAEVYGKEQLEKTHGIGSELPSNRVIETKEFKDLDEKGGWVYNFQDQTGEIHPNLPENIYGQSIKWIKR